MATQKTPARPRRARKHLQASNPREKANRPSLAILSPRKTLLKYQELDLEEVDQAIRKITYYPPGATRTVWAKDPKTGKQKMNRVQCGGEKIEDMRDLDIHGLARLIELRSRLVDRKAANLPKENPMGSYLGIKFDRILEEAVKLAPKKRKKVANE